MEQRVWYAAYGSNLCRSRFQFYLTGGRPPKATRCYPGARDRTPPHDERAVLLPGQLYFAWESTTWTGGVAVYDPAGPAGAVAARVYLLTTAQFSDIAAQEMHRPPGTTLDVYGLLTHAPTAVLGDGRYETLHRVGELEGLPVVTFSAPWTAQTASLNAPSPNYLQLLARGLRESQGWSADDITAYLLAAPGVNLSWDRIRLASLVASEGHSQPRGLPT